MKTTSILKAGAAPLALSLALVASPALAQVSDGPLQPEDETANADGTPSEGATIVVTGSRIARPNIEAASPVTVVSAEQVQLTGTTTVENLLNELPQVIPGNTRVSNNAGGENFSTIDLRGLGAGRTLILLDGERLPASTTTGVTDVSQIPTGLIERVEVVTGGASAVYGSDAIAGVVNFILKDDFEGVELTAQSGISEDGTGFNYNFSGLVGGNFADNRGNISVYGSYTKRGGVGQGRYDYSRVSGAIYLPIDDATGQYGIPYVADDPSDVRNTPGFTQAVASSGGSATPPWGVIDNNAANPFQNLGTLLPGNFGAGNTDTNCDGVAGGAYNTGALSFNDAGELTPRNGSGLCSIPLRSIGSSRYNFAPDNYLITPYDRLTITANGHYEFTDSTRLKFYTSYTNANQEVSLAPTPATQIVVPADSPLIPADLQVALASRPDPDAPFIINRRFTETGPRLGYFTTDAKNVRAILEHDLSDNWAVNLVGSFGRIDNKSRNEGNIRNSALAQGLSGCPTGSAPGCVAVDIFGPNTLTPAMLSFVALTTTDTETFEQVRVASNLTGSLFELPGGPLGIAIGAEYRKDTGSTFVDDAKRTGDIIGFNAQNDISGSINVKEVYGEIRAPILSLITLGAGARYSDYSSVGGLFNWKAEAEFTPTDWIKVRGSFNKAARAPNVFELFQNGNQGFPSYTDPCNASSTSRDEAFCIAQGVPASVIDTFSQNNQQVQAFAFGNPNLSEEKAETYTAGVVLTPGYLFGGRVTLTADYYHIKLENRVAAQGAQFFLSQCYTQQVASACARITRDPGTGQVTAVNTTVVNSEDGNDFITAGIDGGLDVTYNAFGGQLYLSDVLTYVDKYSINGTNFTDTTSPGFGGVIPKWANTATVGWRNDTITGQVRYVWKKGAKQNYPGAFLDGLYPYDLNDPDFASLYDQFPDRIPDLHLVNLSLRWQAAENFEFTAIVDNLLDKTPPQTTTGIFEQSNTNISFYDRYALGRTYTFQARVKF
ncbi:TonB-dependent receptor [Erythrobacter sp. 3-20A1M]|uniref:TonB-dependent receptor plug domain-containing protein n=1 Tax=Erythrobacter sp. 3-20A1M TaxID=2653850 RepID=UPI001BFBFD20|nr:TonB-dependent receptor [Erythrobacter sp. 3-20A1M]QWC56237.1 TonB-dependent receptor [Erythrobacter sp. 3-20A1M]